MATTSHPSTTALMATGASQAQTPRWPLRRISVLVPVRNEVQGIRAVLDDLCAQHYPRNLYEVLVIDGCSTDGTPQLVAQYAMTRSQVRLLHNPRRLSSAARNIGVAAATGDLVIIVDGHCRLRNRHYLSQINALFGPDIWCVGRPQPLEADKPTSFQEAVRLARSSPLGHHPASFIYSSGNQIVPASSVAIAYRRELFRLLGPFEECFDACEDVEFNHRVDRAGLKCHFSSTIAVAYAPRKTAAGLLRQMVRYGSGRMRLLGKHPDTRSVVSTVPGFLLALLLMLGMLVGISYWLVLGLSLAVGGYGLLVGVVTWRLTWSNQCPGLAGHLLLAFASIHGGLGAGQAVETLCG